MAEAMDMTYRVPPPQALSRRAVLFEAQQQVLEGKARTLARFRDRLVELDELLGGVDQGPIKSITAVSSARPGTPLAGAPDHASDGGPSSIPDRGTVLRRGAHGSRRQSGIDGV